MQENQASGRILPEGQGRSERVQLTSGHTLTPQHMSTCLVPRNANSLTLSYTCSWRSSSRARKPLRPAADVVRIAWPAAVSAVRNSLSRSAFSCMLSCIFRMQLVRSATKEDVLANLCYSSLELTSIYELRPAAGYGPTDINSQSPTQ